MRYLVATQQNKQKINFEDSQTSHKAGKNMIYDIISKW